MSEEEVLVTLLSAESRWRGARARCVCREICNAYLIFIYLLIAAELVAL